MTAADLLATATLEHTRPSGLTFWRLPDGRRIWLMRDGTGYVQSPGFGPWQPLADAEPTQDALPLEEL